MSTEETTTGKMIVLRSSDGQRFEVDEAIAVQSQSIKHMIEDGCADSIIPIANVDSKILAMVIEYCSKHVPNAKEDTKEFDAEFMKVDPNTLYYLIFAANYLEIKSLLELACQAAADKIKGKTPEEIREYFNIKNDFTPEEEEEIRKQNSWQFE